MTSNDVLVLLPWLLFACSVAVIVVALLRGRSGFDDTKPSGPPRSGYDHRHVTNSDEKDDDASRSPGRGPITQDGRQTAGGRHATHGGNSATHGGSSPEPAERKLNGTSDIDR